MKRYICLKSRVRRWSAIHVRDKDVGGNHALEHISSEEAGEWMTGSHHHELMGQILDIPEGGDVKLDDLGIEVHGKVLRCDARRDEDVESAVLEALDHPRPDAGIAGANECSHSRTVHAVVPAKPPSSLQEPGDHD